MHKHCIIHVYNTRIIHVFRYTTVTHMHDAFVKYGSRVGVTQTQPSEGRMSRRAAPLPAPDGCRTRAAKHRHVYIVALLILMLTTGPGSLSGELRHSANSFRRHDACLLVARWPCDEMSGCTRLT